MGHEVLNTERGVRVRIFLYSCSHTDKVARASNGLLRAAGTGQCAPHCAVLLPSQILFKRHALFGFGDGFTAYAVEHQFVPDLILGL